MRGTLLFTAFLLAAGPALADPARQGATAQSIEIPRAPIGPEINIDDNGPNDPGPFNPLISDPLENGSPTHPYDTIQEAIDASSNGWTLIVATGRYRENINFDGKSIILRSTDPLNAKVVASTTIDGTNSGPVVTFRGDEAAGAGLLGFRIVFGSAGYGAGISGAGTKATIRYNFITSNTATRQGGGLYRCHGLVANNTITTNSVLNDSQDISLYGGGLCNCDGRITSNTISGNLVQGSKYSDSRYYNQAGGGLALCDGPIEGNLISGNMAVRPYGNAFRGRGAGLYACQGTIRNNRIDGNRLSGYGGGLNRCDGIIEYNIISNNYGEWGGGGVDECDGLVRGNTVDGNKTSEFGPGISRCPGIIQANLVINSYSYGANGWGGGIHECNGEILDNVVAYNQSYLGGGGISSSDGLIQNNSILFNSDGSDAGIYDCHGTINNCILWGNATPVAYQLKSSSVPTYSCIEGWTVATGGAGNTAANPLLLNIAARDFRLTAASPCVDAGRNAVLTPDRADMDKDGDTSETTPLDFAGLPRVIDGNSNGVATVDMGAHEFTPLAPGALTIPGLSAAALASVSVPIRISGIGNLHSISGLEIRYDPHILHLPGASRVTAGSLITGWPLTVTITETSTSGVVRISAAGTGTVSAGGAVTLCTVRFDVVGWPWQRSLLGLGCQGLMTPAGANLPVKLLSGAVSIVPKVTNGIKDGWWFYGE